MTSDRAAPARRVDAVRNRDRILAVARAAFADPDADLSMAEISRRAGVGMATLYRNFPGRRELLEAVYVDEVDAICAAAVPEVTGAEPADQVFVAWLLRFFEFSTGKRPISNELLAQAPGSKPFFNANRARVLDAARPLLDAAQREHGIRADLTIEHVLDLVVAVASIPGDREYVRSILATAIDGLRRSHDGQDGN